MEQYRIGDFAKYLGVTPDLLKHYEDMGIIQSIRSESGYRYYHDDVNWLCHVGVYKDENGEVSCKKIEIPDAWKGDLSEAHEKRYVLLFPGEAEAMGK